MIRILVKTNAPHSAVSWYRGLGVLSKLKNVQCVVARDNISWDTLASFDIVFMERPSLPEDVKIVMYCRDLNIPVWCDFDDDLFSVPVHSIAYEHFVKKDTQKNIAFCADAANVVTVSTQSIAESMREHVQRKDLVIIPNAHNDFTHKWNPEFSTAKTITWRGSVYHRDDILEYLDPLADFANSPDFPKDWVWYWIGSGLWYVQKKMSAIYQKETDIVSYFRMLSDRKYGIFHYPLFQDRFTAGKSNICWMEATYAGAVMLGPDMPEWQKPGITHYTTGESYIERLKELIGDEDYRRKLWKKSADYIRGNLLLSRVNAHRQSVLEGLL